MAAVQEPSLQDLDILEAIHSIIARYPPLTADRHRLQIAVRDGVVLLAGHDRTPITRLYLIDRVSELDGVRGINADGLYDDESIRLEIGRILPEGVIANVTYGIVVLSGKLPAGTTEAAVTKRAGAVPGVVQVVTHFL
ncbi:MAG: BON domain-containing protein [Anaerolineae bacterium]|nr:BON domain-containing protein [Anaerolineae bacterium]